MTDAEELERGYRRWLRCYPKAFRREHGAEILGVLMAGAREGQRRPEPVECLDLMSSALSMHLRPRVARSNRSVHNAVKLMYVGAVVEIAAAIMILTTIGQVASDVLKSNPDLTESVVAAQIEPKGLVAVLAVAFWLWMAWSIGRGHRWARFVFALFFAFNIYGLLDGLVQGSAVYARPDLTIGTVLCLVELASLPVIFRVRVPISQLDTNRITPGA